MTDPNAIRCGSCSQHERIAKLEAELADAYEQIDDKSDIGHAVASVWESAANAWEAKSKELEAERDDLQAQVERLKSAGGWAILFEQKTQPLLEQARQEERQRITQAIESLLITPDEVADAFKDKPDSTNGPTHRWAHNAAIENVLQLIAAEPKEP